MKFYFTILSIYLLIPFFIPLLGQDTFEEYFKQQEQAQEQVFDDEISEFQNYVAEVTSQYKAYEQQQAREFEEFKKSVEEKWQDFKAPSKKKYVEYDEDLNSRATIDFENGEITVEVIVEEEIGEPSVEPTEKVDDTIPK